MATQCIDISADKNLTNASPIAMYAFILCYIVTNMFMQPSFLYIIVVAVELVLCQLLFQFSPRVVYLTILFLFKHTTMSPNFKDNQYYPNEKELKGLKKLIKKEELNE